MAVAVFCHFLLLFGNYKYANEHNEKYTTMTQL